MIIIDTNPQPTHDKHNASAGNDGSGPSQTPPPPPPYNPQTSYQAPEYYPVRDVVVVYSESPTERFWKAFGVAVLIWFLIAAFTNSFAEMAFNHRPSRVGEPPHLQQYDGTVHQCIAGSNWTLSNLGLNHFPHSAEVFLELPADSDAIYLFTRGSHQSGHVDIVQSTTATDEVGVRVRVSYQTPEALHQVNVCRLERRANENGIGIITPMLGFLNFPHIGQQLRFDVKILLPAGKHGEALHIKSFETETSNYSQDVADLWDTVSFDRISLRTANGHVNVKSITVEDCLIHSSNGAIKGHFNSNSSIKLITSNAAIQASVSLLNREDGKPSELKMTTSNSEIDSKVDLITDSGQGGIFDVKTHTSNGAVTLEYTEMPVDAVLNSETRSSNAASRVELHSAFEGSFELVTSNAAAIIKEMPAEDPSGEGRRRVVTRKQERYRAEGSAYWGESEGNRRQTEGRVTVVTSNGRVELVI